MRGVSIWLFWMRSRALGAPAKMRAQQCSTRSLILGRVWNDPKVMWPARRAGSGATGGAGSGGVKQ